MKQKSEGAKGFWMWIIFLFVALSIYGLPQNIKNNISSIVRAGLFSPFVWVDSQYKIMRDNLSRLIRTERELAQTKLELQNSIEEKLENQRLRKLLDFKSNSKYSLILAEIVGIKGMKFPAGLIINKGKRDGVEDNMPVLTADGAIGRVKSAGTTTSVIQILLDPALKISVLDQRSRVVGMLVSPDARKLLMEQVPADEDIAVGDRIIASGYGGIFPKGILIGYVISVSEPPEGMFKRIVVEPSASLSRIEEVFVLKDMNADSSNIDTIETKIHPTK
ncbi:rod shape-determining protein MreC [bacterium]|nr:MAG: rod shape-determining protein MreC [bacterium]